MAGINDEKFRKMQDEMSRFEEEIGLPDMVHLPPEAPSEAFAPPSHPLLPPPPPLLGGGLPPPLHPGMPSLQPPGGLPPHPGGIPPHPGGLPPFPGSLPPHPGALPHPGDLPPHPGGMPPHPGGMPPHPGSMPPPPGMLPPHPGSMPPPLHPGAMPSPMPGNLAPPPGMLPPHPGDMHQHPGMLGGLHPPGMMGGPPPPPPLLSHGGPPGSMMPPGLLPPHMMPQFQKPIEKAPAPVVLSSTPMLYSAGPRVDPSPPIEPVMSKSIDSGIVGGLMSSAAEKKKKIEKVTVTVTTEPVVAATQQPQSKKKEKKNRKLMRTAGGQTWEDSTLGEWDDDDFRLFCGDLGNDVTDEVLSRAFSKYPSFNKAKVIRDKRTNKTKGFGFVSFKDPQDFIKANKEMNGRYVGSRPIKLRKSTWKNRSLDVVRKKDKEKATLISLLTGK